MDKFKPNTSGAPKSAPSPTRFWRIAVPVLLVVTVIVVFASKPDRKAAPSAAVAPALTASHGAVPAATGIPRLVDLGAHTCIPCKAMAPILIELRTEFEGRMKVDFIDVWETPGAGDPYNIRAIPTQVFFDASGKELTRHEGFISKEDILATWKRYGFDFGPAGVPTPRS